MTRTLDDCVWEKDWGVHLQPFGTGESAIKYLDERYPDFRHALGTQYVCDAVLESARSKQWVEVKTA